MASPRRDPDGRSQDGWNVAMAIDDRTVNAAPLPMMVQNSGQKSDAKLGIVLASLFFFSSFLLPSNIATSARCPVGPSRLSPGDVRLYVTRRRSGVLRLRTGNVSAEQARLTGTLCHGLNPVPGFPDSIVIRTGSGSVIAAHGDGRVSFEADHFDLELGQGWSVLVRGDAHRVLQPDELRILREGCGLRPWPAGEHDLFVRIVPGQLTGRRIRSQ
jgi:hypothetical protein